MDQALSPTPDYKFLSENGLKLSEAEFNTILNEIKKGVLDTKNYLNALDNPNPKFSFLNNIGIFGYSTENDSINIRIDYLNLFANSPTSLKYKDQLVCFVPDKFYVIVKYLTWLRLFGREETIHYFQYHGSPQVKVKFPDKFPESFSPKSLLLSDIEVEARTIGDKIAVVNNEIPVWKNIDEYFSKNFPEYYNKPIELLATLPRPNLQISFEMENLMT